MSMLQLRYTVPGDDFTRAGEASGDVKHKLKKLGYNPSAIRRVSIAMYEGEINMVIHAGGGEANVDVDPDKVVIVLTDHGPGIADVEKAMQEGWSTAPDNVRSLGFGAGMGLPKEQIGCFFITPCPAKVTDIRMPIGIEKSEVDGAIAISEIFPQLSSRMDKLTPKDLESLSNSGIIGVSWATSGGESSALLKEKYLAADGIENVIRVLEEIEDERIGELDFIELNACSGGCVGGVLCVENPYVAIARLQRLRKYLPVSQNHLEKNKTVPEEMNWGSGLEFSNVLTLSEDISRAMEMMMEIDKVEAELPGLDCGACGAPSCRAFAEDTVRGSCRKEDCVFILRKEIRRFADSLSNLDLDGGKRTSDDE